MDCIFCKIVQKDIPAELVFENETILAFKDIQPLAPVHILIIPKKHVADLNDLERFDLPLMSEIYAVVPKLAKQFEIDQTGYRVFINCGPDAGQEVHHLHVHLIGGDKLGNGA